MSGAADHALLMSTELRPPRRWRLEDSYTGIQTLNKVCKAIQCHRTERMDADERTARSASLIRKQIDRKLLP
jgi:hypothetical protein